MTDLLYFFGAIGGFIVMGCTIYFIDKADKCWHKWGKWNDDSTDDAYVQFRICDKCGYIAREQWRKLKEENT
jgi:hypothetical protein